MKAICIDGQPNEKHVVVVIPEWIPLDVYEVSEEPDYYHVMGYNYNPPTKDIIIWHKRRFIPLSDIDESELVNKAELVHA